MTWWNGPRRCPAQPPVKARLQGQTRLLRVWPSQSFTRSELVLFQLVTFVVSHPPILHHGKKIWHHFCGSPPVAAAEAVRSPWMPLTLQAEQAQLPQALSQSECSCLWLMWWPPLRSLQFIHVLLVLKWRMEQAIYQVTRWHAFAACCVH